MLLIYIYMSMVTLYWYFIDNGGNTNPGPDEINFI